MDQIVEAVTVVVVDKAIGLGITIALAVGSSVEEVAVSWIVELVDSFKREVAGFEVPTIDWFGMEIRH